MDYDKEQLKAIQEKALEILLYFKEICDQHGIRFYVGSGCCIGAVRHHGFIPWDDDIDVFLLREDYERLPEIWNSFADTNRYAYCRTTEKENYHDAGASIRDNNTTFINTHCINDDINQGLQIDLIPLDRRADGVISHGKQVFWAMVYSLFNAQRLPDNQGGMTRLLAKIAYGIFSNKRIRDKIWQYAEQKMLLSPTDSWTYYTELVTGLKGLTLKYPKDFWDKPCYLLFEGHQIPVPSRYEEYLTMVFGDYMKLPPQEDQVPKHNTAYIDLNHSYKNYRGIHYFLQGKNEKNG